MPEALSSGARIRIPVLYRQAAHLPEMLGVIGYDRRPQAEGVGGDEGVERADGTAVSFKLMAHLPVCEGREFIERRNMELQQKPQQLFALSLRHGTFHYHELQFREHDGRKHHSP